MLQGFLSILPLCLSLYYCRLCNGQKLAAAAVHTSSTLGKLEYCYHVYTPGIDVNMSIRASVPRSRISPKKIRRPPSLSEIPKSSYIKVVNVRFVSAMEYEKTYVFKPGERPSKRRRVEPKGLQSSWKLRQAAYQEAWREQQSKIDVSESVPCCCVRIN